MDAGQNVGHIDYLFTGNTLGHKTDIADGSLRGYEFRTFENIQARGDVDRLTGGFTAALTGGVDRRG